MENFRENVGKTFSGGNFHNNTPISFIKAYGFYIVFLPGDNFREDKKREKHENYPHAKISTFTVH